MLKRFLDRIDVFCENHGLIPSPSFFGFNENGNFIWQKRGPELFQTEAAVKIGRDGPVIVRHSSPELINLPPDEIRKLYPPLKPAGRRISF